METTLQTFVLLLMYGAAHSQLNLASNGTATQSSNYQNHFANLAITGGPTHEWNTFSCSATSLDKKVAWWMLTFSSETVFTSNVIIYYRSITPDRLAGYSLYITNSSISTSATGPPTDGHLCYHHTEDKLPNILQNITCDQLGKHVIIYNERKNGETYPKNYSDIAILEICDAQIIGCFKTLFGDGCGKICPKYCIDQHCHPTNGSCIWGCSSTVCLYNDCSNDGFCTSGCKKGQAGLFCDKKNVASDVVLLESDSPSRHVSQLTDGDKTRTSCVKLNDTNSWLQVDTGEVRIINTINIIFTEITSYEYSIEISNTSGSERSKSLKVTNDNIVTYMLPFPVHEHRLSPSITGRYVVLSKVMKPLDICEVEIIGCPSGFYGESCNMKCPINCEGPCNPENGQCVLGCRDGYIGLSCNKACTPPHFGRSCSKTCHCMLQPCNFINGTCPTGGCREGWEGHSCSKECGLGRFGKNCEQTCEGCILMECEADIGKCKDLTGCRVGWKNEYPMCDIACTPPQFGTSCNNTCHCVNQPCDFITGVCPSGGCQEGWIGSSCSKEISCRADNLSENLKYTPSIPKLRFNQNVTFYCAPGFYGVALVSTCGKDNQWIPSPPSCTDSLEYAGISVTTFVSAFVSVIVISIAVIVIVVFIFHKRINKSQQRLPAEKYEEIQVYKISNNRRQQDNTYEELG